MRIRKCALLFASLFVLSILQTIPAALVEVTSDIDTDATWSGGNTYYVNMYDLNVKKGATLTIEAGAVVKVNFIFNVKTGGKIVSNGTSTSPVYFTSTHDDSVGETVSGSSGDPDSNHWLALDIAASSGPDITKAEFHYTHFLYGGGTPGVNGSPMVDAHACNPVFDHCTFKYSNQQGFGGDNSGSIPMNAEFDACIFQNNDSHGIDISDGIGPSIPKITGCRFIGNGTDSSSEAAVNLEDNVFPDWGDSSNTVDKIQGRGMNAVRCRGNISITGTWNRVGTDFPIASRVDLSEGADLTINSGVIVKMADRDGWERMDIDPGATIRVKGSASDPVYFTSMKDDKRGGDSNGDGAATTASPGDWLSIFMTNSGDGKTVTGQFTFAKFSYGGGMPGVYQRGMIRLEGVSPSFESCTFSRSKYHAIEGHENNDTASQPVFEGCYFLQNERSGIWIEDNNTAQGAKPEISGCTFSGNGTDLNDGAMLFEDNVFPDWGLTANTLVQLGSRGANAVLYRGNISISGAWKKPGADFPFLLDSDINIRDGATLTIHPGVILKNQDPTSRNDIYVNAGGTLNIAGTKTEPVVLTSFRDDTWGGDTNGDLSLSTPAPGDWGHIGFESESGGKRGSGVFNNAIILYGEDGMISIAGCKPEITDCELKYADGWAVHAWRSNDLAPEATITGCLITENTGGVRNDDDQHCLDATGNNWGHYTGPKDDSDADDCADYYNPNAKGDAVTDNVLVKPWLIPEGMKFLDVSANLQARAPVNGNAALSIRINTYGLEITNLGLSLDLTEAPGVVVNETESTHTHPFTAATFTGGLFTYYLDLGTNAATMAVIVNVSCDQGEATLAIPMRVEDNTDPIAPDANSDGIANVADIIATLKYITGQ